MNYRPILSAEDIRSWDAATLEQEGISAHQLMEKAATTAFEKIRSITGTESFLIFCGQGNNGGDGLVIAGKMLEEGLQATVYVCLLYTSPSPRD